MRSFYTVVRKNNVQQVVKRASTVRIKPRVQLIMKVIRNSDRVWVVLGADNLIIAIGSWSEVSGVMKAWTTQYIIV